MSDEASKKGGVSRGRRLYAELHGQPAKPVTSDEQPPVGVKAGARIYDERHGRKD